MSDELGSGYIADQLQKMLRFLIFFFFLLGFAFVTSLLMWEIIVYDAINSGIYAIIVVKLSQKSCDAVWLYSVCVFHCYYFQRPSLLFFFFPLYIEN